MLTEQVLFYYTLNNASQSGVVRLPQILYLQVQSLRTDIGNIDTAQESASTISTNLLDSEDQSWSPQQESERSAESRSNLQAIQLVQIQKSTKEETEKSKCKIERTQRRKPKKKGTS